RAFAARRALSVDEVLDIALRIVRVLGEVHKRRVIHKDVNPSNIVLNPETHELKLIDFGLSTQLSRESAEADPVETLAGTLPYPSPEQTGRMNRAVDSRADLYALGVTLYEILTGELPFTASDAIELIHCHLAREPVPAHQRSPAIPIALSRV